MYTRTAMNKRNLWKYEETMEMLLIMKKNNFPSQFSNKHNQNMQIFRTVEAQMAERGYTTKSGEQICVRWKNLKNQYFKVKRSNDKNEQELFPYFVEMEELVGEKASKSSQVPGDDDGAGATASHSNETVNPTGPHGSEAATSAPREQAVPTRVPRKRRLLYGSGTVENNPRPMNRLEMTLASTKQELSDEFYRTQKRLIDYEFNLYMKKEEEIRGQLQETTRNMLEEFMDRFFVNLKQAVGQQGTEVPQVTFVEIHEDQEGVL